MFSSIILDSVSPLGLIIGLIVLAVLFAKPKNVICKSCGWKGSKNKWKSSGDSCPNCHSDLFKEG